MRRHYSEYPHIGNVPEDVKNDPDSYYNSENNLCRRVVSAMGSGMISREDGDELLKELDMKTQITEYLVWVLFVGLAVGTAVGLGRVFLELAIKVL